MIKYLELTAPESSEFRQCKITSIEVNEGDTVKAGDALFKVQSGRNEIELPSKMDGTVVELIATEGENISLMTPLILLETQIEASTATRPITDQDSLANEQKASDTQPESSEAEPAPSETQPELNEVKPESVTKKKKTTANSRKQTSEASKHQQPLDLGDDTIPDQTSNTNPSASTAMTQSIIPISVPDIGGNSAKVIEILVSVGDNVSIEDPLITLESDKASMDVPSSHDGVITKITVELDQDVSEGTVIVELGAEATSQGGTSVEDNSPTAEPAPSPESTEPKQAEPEQTAPVKPAPEPTPTLETAPTSPPNHSQAHASPSVRRFARELGVNLDQVTGTGRKNRITKNDVTAFVKGVMSNDQAVSGTAVQGAGIPAVPAQDFSQFGEIDIQPLNNIKRATAENLHRSWLNVPHVTHNDESNITDLEEFRNKLNAEYKKQGRDIKLSPLAFIVKAMVKALQTYPQFNSSLEPGGQNLIYKKYINIGIAVETPNGLVVPVIKDTDTLSVAEIAQEMGELAQKARNKKLTMKDMSGACITISSLGGIGGTHFTPIVNAPEVAILGVSRSKIEPVWNGSEFKPGNILPLSLSYDHRVIDGAEAARFTRYIAALLEDIRRLSI